MEVILSFLKPLWPYISGFFALSGLSLFFYKKGTSSMKRKLEHASVKSLLEKFEKLNDETKRIDLKKKELYKRIDEAKDIDEKANIYSDTLSSNPYGMRDKNKQHSGDSSH